MSLRKKNERTIWIIQRNKETIVFKTNETKNKDEQFKAVRTILKKDRFLQSFKKKVYWTKNFTERSFSENRNEIDNNNFKNERINFFWTNEMGHSQTMDERNEKTNTPISKLILWVNYACKINEWTACKCLQRKLANYTLFSTN